MHIGNLNKFENNQKIEYLYSIKIEHKLRLYQIPIPIKCVNDCNIIYTMIEQFYKVTSVGDII